MNRYLYEHKIPNLFQAVTSRACHVMSGGLGRQWDTTRCPTNKSNRSRWEVLVVLGMFFPKQFTVGVSPNFDVRRFLKLFGGLQWCNFFP